MCVAFARLRRTFNHNQSVALDRLRPQNRCFQHPWLSLSTWIPGMEPLPITWSCLQFYFSSVFKSQTKTLWKHLPGLAFVHWGFSRCIGGHCWFVGALLKRGSDVLLQAWNLIADYLDLVQNCHSKAHSTGAIFFMQGELCACLPGKADSSINPHGLRNCQANPLLLLNIGLFLSGLGCYAPPWFTWFSSNTCAKI